MKQPRSQSVSTPPEPTSTLATLDSPSSKLVYLYLETKGEATVDDIREELDITLMTAYSLLDTFLGRGLVSKRDGTYTTASR